MMPASEGGEARNHEAEVEAVARAIAALQRALEYPPAAHTAHWQRRAADAIAALDAVRRSPEGEYPREESGGVIVIGPGCFAMRDRSVLNWEGVNYVPQPSPQGEDHEHRCRYELDAEGDLACPVCGRYADDGDEAADAQGEDHEAASRVSQDHDPGRDD